MQLETDRLILREFEGSDWTAVLAYQSDPLYLRYYHWTERSQKDVKRFVKMFLHQQQERPRTIFQLAVVPKDKNQLIGNCGIRINNVELREANIGYELDSRFWGKGYATEAAQAILRFGFIELGLHRIFASTLAVNKGSARVLEKLGMRLEARELEKEFIKGRWYDNLTYAILDREWIDE
ncbi:MAG: GNAT family N-acetyltransferase [Anaerolineaceae bacterium]|nr:MAG: GNAT family N-acetyltransferase [Anaerolineaceae bacterium]